jgi:hypothetical protein
VDRSKPDRHLGPLWAHGRPASVGGLARAQQAPSGARPERHAWVPDPPDHPGDDTPRRGHVACGRPRCAVTPARAGRHRTNPTPHESAEGCPVRQHRARRGAGLPGLGPRLSPGPPGDGPIRHTAPSRRGTQQRVGGAAVGQRATHWQTMRGMTRAPHRPHGVEPRVKTRRPTRVPLMITPRQERRQQLLQPELSGSLHAIQAGCIWMLRSALPPFLISSG